VGGHAIVGLDAERLKWICKVDSCGEYGWNDAWRCPKHDNPALAAPAPQNSQDDLLTFEQAGAALPKKVSAKTVQRHIDKYGVPTVGIGNTRFVERSVFFASLRNVTRKARKAKN
jgi:hypothetical protein